MIKKILHIKNLIWVLVVIIAFAGLKYRLRSYEAVPFVATSFDEQDLVWIGSSLINNGVPVGWSFIPDYQNLVLSGKGDFRSIELKDWSIQVNWQKPEFVRFKEFQSPVFKAQEYELDGYRSQFAMVQPYLEQPPLGAVMASFLSGSFLLKDFGDVSLGQIRLPVIYLSIINILLIIYLARALYGNMVGIFSGAIYAFSPIIILSNRLATAESYLVPVFLISVVFMYKWIKTDRIVFFYLSLVLMYMAYLIKPFGIVLSPFLVLIIILFGKNRRYIFGPVFAGILSVASFYFYGFLYDFDLYLKVSTYQMGRLLVPLEGIFKILVPKVGKVFLDGWVIFGWMSVVWLMLEKKKDSVWVLGPLFFYLLFLTIFGGEDYGWYRAPIYPFLAIAAGGFIAFAVKEFNYFTSLLFLMTVFATSLFWGTYGINWREFANIFRLIMILFAGLLSLHFVGFTKLARAVFIFIILLSFYFNIQTINRASVIWPDLQEDTSLAPLNR